MSYHVLHFKTIIHKYSQYQGQQLSHTRVVVNLKMYQNIIKLDRLKVNLSVITQTDRLQIYHFSPKYIHICRCGCIRCQIKQTNLRIM